MVNTRIKSIIFFAAKDGEALYSQQKQDQELTVAQVMNSLFQIQIYKGISSAWFLGVFYSLHTFFKKKLW